MAVLNRIAACLSSVRPTWQTPDDLLDRLRAALGPIELDPCTSPENPTRAKRYYVHLDDVFSVAYGFIGAHAAGRITDGDFRAGQARVKELHEEHVDGLAADWNIEGLVYANPPYGRGIGEWVEKGLSSSCEIVYLLPSRTDQPWFSRLLSEAAVCFFRRRIKFKGAPSGAPFPSILAYRPDPREPYRASVFHDAFADMGVFA